MRRSAVLIVGLALFGLATLEGRGAEAPASAAPDSSPADTGSRWTTMTHGYAFLTSNKQGGGSGGRDFESANHLMVMAERRCGAGRLTLLGGFTLEPATIPPQGAPLLFQRGETYRGVLLVDRQHPHDLFVELAAAWERPLADHLSLRLYAAPRGAPALGPTAYPHRPSASENPLAPLAHHNQDSTHVSQDVLTMGLTAARVTVEGSLFHGREPDENRWDLEQGRPDSYSGRVTLRAAGGFTFQVSAGHREHPEAIEPGDQTRQTASVEFERRTGGGFVAAALILGRDLTPEARESGDGVEATWKFHGGQFLYGRVESVTRDRFELLDKTERPAGVAPDLTTVRAATLGYAHDVPWLREAETGLGAGLTVYRFDETLDAVYGRHPLGMQAFLRLRFGAPASGGHHH